ncbi:hypothetical protein NMY22_g6848 [Coprinellus aureogranulatus]|nr:hypothetical protein NMY22_g6848 [Coprinellus aureogranulatus]
MPDDLFDKELKKGITFSMKYTLLSLRRTITPVDLARYTTYYAHRIRHVSIRYLGMTFSAETWQAIQLTVGWNPGALAPYNCKLTWQPASYIIPEDLVRQAFAYFTLFLSPSTLSLRFTISSKIPVQAASITAASNRQLKELDILDTALQNGSTPAFIDTYITSFPWHTLQTLKVGNISTATLAHIASLPRLSTLDIFNMPSPPGANEIPGEAFPSLRNLILHSDNIDYFASFLKCLAPTHPIQVLKFILTSYTEEKRPGDVIDAVSGHCNPLTLRKFVLKETTAVEDVREPLDIDPGGFIDLSPLHAFHNLEVVSISLTHEVYLESNDITAMSASWPSLKKLKIDVDFPSSRLPIINHSDFLTLLYNCRNLEKIGLRFDGTQIEEHTPPPDDAKYGQPAPLKKLWVSDSPILSPSAVASFLKTHCPNLLTRNMMDVWKPFEYEGEDPPEGRFVALYGRRWRKVEELIDLGRNTFWLSSTLLLTTTSDASKLLSRPHSLIPVLTGLRDTAKASEHVYPIPEILRLICDQIPNDLYNRRRLFITALSCRALLEPALDSLWFSLDSLQPLVSCLPDDLFNKEQKKFSDRSTVKYTLLTLRRAITPADLARYTSYYAPRIRHVCIETLSEVFSVETWQAIQLSAGWNPGVLAPFNCKLTWQLTSHTYRIPQGVMQPAFAYFTLFLSPSTLSLQFTISSDIPVQVGSITAACDRPLKELAINDTALQNGPPPAFIDSFLTSFSWSTLKCLRVTNITTPTLVHIASLPLLSILHISQMSLPPDASEIPGRAFPSLEILVLSSASTNHFVHFLKCLSQTHQIRVLKFTLTPQTVEEKSPRDVIAAISEHCNPDTLREFVFKETTPLEDVHEPLDVSPDCSLDLSPLYAFHTLEIVSINLTQEVALDSYEIPEISSNWPFLKKFKIDVDLPSSGVPNIDHTDFLALLYNCRHLTKLGLRFNGTKITARTPAPPNAKYDKPAPVKKLWVSDSPIRSPSAVAKFLKTHCPSLSSDDMMDLWKCLEYEGEDPPEDTFNALYGRRWRKVEEIMDAESDEDSEEE